MITLSLINLSFLYLDKILHNRILSSSSFNFDVLSW